MRLIPFLSAKTPFLVCIIFVTTVTTVTTYTIPLQAVTAVIPWP